MGSFADVGVALEAIRVQATAVGQAMRNMRLDAESALAAVEKAKKEGRTAERTAGVKRKTATSKVGAAEGTDRNGPSGPSTDQLDELHRQLVAKNGRS